MFELFVGDWNLIELLEKIADAPTFEHHRAPRDFSGMGGKDGDDEDAPQPFKRRFGGNAGGLHRAQGATKSSALRVSISGDLARKPAPFAVVGFGEVDEFEVEAEGAAQLVALLDGDAADVEDRLLHEGFGFVDVAVSLRLATPDGALPQLLDFGVQIVASLFAQDLAEQGTERTNIAPQRSFLQFTGASL